MCTLVALHRAHADAELVVALNRDEHYGRRASVPGLHGDAFYGLDLLRGGTWFGARRSGLVVALTNRRGENLPGAVQSRGAIVTAALRLRSSSDVHAWLARLDVEAYSGFNLLYGDGQALYLASGGFGRPRVAQRALEPGLWVVLNESAERGGPAFKARRVRHLLRAKLGGSWPDLRRACAHMLADHQQVPVEALEASSAESIRLERALSAICVHTPDYGTRSSTIVRIAQGRLHEYLHAERPPCQAGGYRMVWRL